MNILKHKTTMFILYLVGEQALRSYLHYRSAANLGPEVQNHEMRKDGISLGRNVIKAIATSAIFGLDNIQYKK